MAQVADDYTNSRLEQEKTYLQYYLEGAGHNLLHLVKHDHRVAATVLQVIDYPVPDALLNLHDMCIKQRNKAQLTT